MSRSFLVFLFLVIASQIVSAVHKQCGTHNLHKASSLLKSRVASTDDGSACLENVVCDDPANIAAYSSVIEKKNQEKLTINARVYIPLNEHNESLVSHKTTKEQIELISSAFSEFHVDLNVQIENITIPSVYYAVVLPYICKKDMLSNGVVNIECNIEENGWDGGDGICKDPAKIEACQKPTAQSDSQSQCDCVVVNFDGKDCTNSSNAKCDPECNYHQFDWDHGDCCQYNKDTTECRDPNASLDQRAWMTSLELKERLGWDNIRSLNTMVVRSQVISGSVVAGVAYYPWSNTSGTSGEDGILIDYRYWGVNKEYLSHGASWIHEVGHALGLWHTFRSVTEFDEASNCTETCQQTDDRAQGGMRSGDLCSDTPPEPLIYECKESVDCSKDSEVSCGSCLNSNFRLLKNNYMNYVAEDGLCKDKTFTLQQKARMRCYLDLLRSGWISNGTEVGQIYKAPQVSKSNTNKLLLKWERPIRYNVTSKRALIYEIERDLSSPKTFFTSSEFYQDMEVNTQAKVKYRVRAFYTTSTKERPLWSPAVVWDYTMKKLDDIYIHGITALLVFLIVVIFSLTVWKQLQPRARH